MNDNTIQDNLYLALQDHRLNVNQVGPERRAAVWGTRIEGRDAFGRYNVEGHERSQSKVRTVGDLLQAFHWEPGSRATGAWFFVAPALTTEPTLKPEQPAVPVARTRPRRGTRSSSRSRRDVGVLPVFSSGWEGDDRFKGLRPAVHPTAPDLPKGTPGIVLCATREDQQHELFFPTQPSPLVAVNNAGDPRLSSLVYDLNAQNELDQQRKARLHTAWRVVRPSGGCKLGRENGLAWQLSLSGQDGIEGRGLVVDQAGALSPPPPDLRRSAPASTRTRPRRAQGGATTRLRNRPGTRARAGLVVALASARASGPLEVGSQNDVHRVGTTKDGQAVNVLHLQTGTLWHGGPGDGPDDFEDVLYEPRVTRSPFMAPTHKRWDPRPMHDWACGKAPGKWRYQTEVPFYVPEDKVELVEITGNPPPVGQCGKPLRDAQGGSELRPTTFPGAIRVAGGMLFKPHATAKGEPSYATGGPIPLGDALAILNMPGDTGMLVGIGLGEGTTPNAGGGGRWSEFKTNEPAPGGQRVGRGGIMVAPPVSVKPGKLHEILNGTVTDDQPMDDEDQVAFLLPSGASCMLFANARPYERCTLTGAGTKVSVNESGQLEFVQLDDDGAECPSPVLTIGKDGIKIDGDLISTGSPTSAGCTDFGGTGDDGAVTINNPTYQGTALHATDLTIGVSLPASTYRPGAFDPSDPLDTLPASVPINPLVILCTGDLTVNGSLDANGKGNLRIGFAPGTGPAPGYGNGSSGQNGDLGTTSLGTIAVPFAATDSKLSVAAGGQAGAGASGGNGNAGGQSGKAADTPAGGNRSGALDGAGGGLGSGTGIGGAAQSTASTAGNAGTAGANATNAHASCTTIVSYGLKASVWACVLARGGASGSAGAGGTGGVSDTGAPNSQTLGGLGGIGLGAGTNNGDGTNATDGGDAVSPTHDGIKVGTGGGGGGGEGNGGGNITGQICGDVTWGVSSVLTARGGNGGDGGDGGTDTTGPGVAAGSSFGGGGGGGGGGAGGYIGLFYGGTESGSPSTENVTGGTGGLGGAAGSSGVGSTNAGGAGADGGDGEDGQSVRQKVAP